MHKKGGRPKSQLGEERNKRITIRVSPIELSVISYKAKQAEKTIGAFLRDLGLTEELKPALTTEQVSFFRDLAGVANNLNQLAKWANTYQSYLPIREQVERIMDKIELIQNHLLR